MKILIILGEGERESIFFESFIHKFYPHCLCRRISKDLDNFFRILTNNYFRSTSYYNHFIWGDFGNPGYLNTYYSRILVRIIKIAQETTHLIVTRDTNGNTEDNLCQNWQQTTRQILINTNSFQYPPNYREISLKETQIINSNNDKIIVSFFLTPRNLEYLIADAYIKEKGLRNPNANCKDHDLFDEIKTQLNKDIEQIIRESVNLNLNSSWIQNLKDLIERPL